MPFVRQPGERRVGIGELLPPRARGRGRARPAAARPRRAPRQPAPVPARARRAPGSAAAIRPPLRIPRGAAPATPPRPRRGRAARQRRAPPPRPRRIRPRAARRRSSRPRSRRQASGRETAAPRAAGSARRAGDSAAPDAPAFLRAPSCAASVAMTSSSRVEVVVGGGEPQLGLASARLQPGGAGGLFEQKPALGRFGLNQRADPSLADDGPGRPAGRGVGEQELHIARPHIAAVDAPDRARRRARCGARFRCPRGR